MEDLPQERTANPVPLVSIRAMGSSLSMMPSQSWESESLRVHATVMMPPASTVGISLPHVANGVCQPKGDKNPLTLFNKEDGMPAAETPAQFLTRAVAYLEETKVPNVAASLFTVFQDTSDLRLLFAAFARLSSLAMNGADQEESCKAASSPSEAKSASAVHVRHKFPYTRIRRLLSTWKAKQLWKTLDQRASRAEYTSAPCGAGGHLAGKRCLVVGAGPCGLRAAVELLLLGARVIVVDREMVFSRINQLSLMRWCGEDLKGLGAAANSFSPSPGSLYAATDRLQLLLLRTALLLGAEIYMGVSFERLSWIAGSWWAELRPLQDHRASGEIRPPPPSQKAPSSVSGLAAVICAAGTSAWSCLQCGKTPYRKRGSFFLTVAAIRNFGSFASHGTNGC